ncbi:MAG: hypothetical protein KGV51_00465 [Moraxellaceae bacterium]|nr:hypothetical protein [Moraxellaceae bacterium]
MQKANISLFNKSLVITAVLATTAPVYANPQAKTFQGNEYAGAKTFQPQNQPEQMATQQPQPQAMPTSAPTTNNQNQQQSNVSHDTKVFVIKMLEGQEALIPLTSDVKVQAGDTLEYQTTVRNNGSDRIKSMQVTLSIPQEVVLIGNTSPEYVLASLNERDFYPAPLQTQRNGAMENIALSNYRGLRWTVNNLGLDKSTTVSYRAKLK